ncbi:MAG TPA: hypothetical protein PKA44_08350 [Saprospiraceae bacterium]|jgi:tetratricopeptide (TPR) repeat protein|nr:hypothetical protein [Saprospiraceae bacterium]HMU59909.1 hypothetical protein [Chitinophagaceae bacterium]
MAKKLSYQSTMDEVAGSLRETLDEIKKFGETKDLKYEMLLKYGRFLFLAGNTKRALEVLTQCSIHGIDNGVAEIREIYYWAARCREAEGKHEEAINGYLMLLERNSHSKYDEDLLNAVLERISLMGDISSPVEDYKKKREEELNNPKDLLGKVIKLLREKT